MFIVNGYELEIEDDYPFHEQEGIDKDFKTYNQDVASWQIRVEIKSTALHRYR